MTPANHVDTDSDPEHRVLLERVTVDTSRAGTFAALSALAKADVSRARGALRNWLSRRAGLPVDDAELVPLYHLLVGRFRSESRHAFEDKATKLSFSELDTRVRLRAAAWSRQGVGPQRVVALGRSFGLEFLCDLLAVFRLGACATWIPPLGQPFEEAALLATKPDFLCEVDACSAHVVPKALLVEPIGIQSTALGLEAPVDYDPKTPCLLVLSVLDGDPILPVFAPPIVLTAPELLLSLAQDATVVWGLRAGDWMTAPGLDDRRHQPYLVLNTLLSGAGYHFVQPEELAAECKWKAYRAFGLSAPVRDLILTTRAKLDVRRWFRVMEEPFEHRAWSTWTELVGADKERCAIAMDPGLGGVALVSVSDGVEPERTRASTDVELVHPAIGVEWQRKVLPGAAPNDAVGLLAFKHPRVAPPYLLVRETQLGLEFLRVLPHRRCGQVFPGGISCAALAGLPGVLGASVMSVPMHARADEVSFGLVVFVAASAGSWTAARRDAVHSIVVRHLARVLHADLCPNFVEIHPILPAVSKQGNTDAAWVSGQRWSGGLERRSQLGLFRRLATIGLRELG